MKKSFDPTKYIHVSTRPSWIDSNTNEKAFGKDFSDILRFYIVFCPCNEYSTQGRTLSFYRWPTKPWSSYRILKGPLDNAASRGFKKNRNMFQWQELSAEWGKSPFSTHDWYTHKSEFAFISNVNDNEYMSLFYHIRCALAHGRFQIITHDKENYYVLENGITKGKLFYVKARIILKEKTLTDWIAIIVNGPKKDAYINDVKDIISEINKNASVSIKTISVTLGIPYSEIQRIINGLKTSIDLKYERKNFGIGFWMYDEKKFTKEYP